jgi:hypothetical protein
MTTRLNYIRRDPQALVFPKNVVNRRQSGAKYTRPGVSFRETGITSKKLTH